MSLLTSWGLIKYLSTCLTPISRPVKRWGVYEDENIAKVIKRADKLKPLLLGALAPDLYMIKAEDYDKMKAMGYESAKNSEEMTKVFYNHIEETKKLFVTLDNVKANYTLLIFWDVDCSHCQKEIPKLLEVYNELICCAYRY